MKKPGDGFNVDVSTPEGQQKKILTEETLEEEIPTSGNMTAAEKRF